MLPSENAPAAVGMREPLLLRDQLLYRGTGGVALDESSLVVEALERCQLFLTRELRALDRRLQHPNRLIVDPKCVSGAGSRCPRRVRDDQNASKTRRLETYS
jgi:hypothetical protein